MDEQVRKVVEQIAQVRETLGWSQAKAAHEGCFCSSQYWSQVESGTKTPGVDVLAKMAAAVGMTLELSLIPGKAKQ